MTPLVYLAGIALLIAAAILRRNRCDWTPEKVRTYRVLSILGLLFAPGCFALRQPLASLAA